MVCPPGFDAEQFLGWLAEFQPTWHTATPAMHQAVLVRAAHHPEVLAQHRLRFIRSSGASLLPQVQAQLEGAFHVPVVESYTSTETGPVVYAPAPSAIARAGSVGKLAPSIEVATLDAVGSIQPPGQPAARSLCAGPPSSPATSTTPRPTRRLSSTTGFAPVTRATWTRTAICSSPAVSASASTAAGEKIAPGEVEAALLAHPAVAQAAAFALPDATLGETVAAAVVLRTGQAASEGELRAQVAGRLAYFKVPARVVVVEALPLGPTGKVARRALAEQLGLLTAGSRPTAERPPYRAPRTPVEARVAAVWAAVLERQDFGITDNFLELAGDSLNAARWMARLQDIFRVDLTVSDFFVTPTVAGMALVITERLGAQLDPEALGRVLAEAEGDGSESWPVARNLGQHSC